MKEVFSSIWLDFFPPVIVVQNFSCESDSSCSPEFTFFRHIATPTSYFPHSDHRRAKLHISWCRNFLLKICYFSSSNKCLLVWEFFFFLPTTLLVSGRLYKIKMYLGWRGAALSLFCAMVPCLYQNFAYPGTSLHHAAYSCLDCYFSSPPRTTVCARCTRGS